MTKAKTSAVETEEEIKPESIFNDPMFQQMLGIRMECAKITGCNGNFESINRANRLVRYVLSGQLEEKQK